jgi:phosphohistidine phosphatase
MKTIFLVRHAKVDVEDQSLPEAERPLTARAAIEVQGMAERLARRDARPDVVLSSPALHARATAEIFARRFGMAPGAIGVDDRLRDSSPEALLALIGLLDERLATVMVVGHNPGVARVAEQLSGGEVTGMPLCAVAELRFDVAQWSQLGQQALALVRFDDRKKPRPAPADASADG